MYAHFSKLEGGRRKLIKVDEKPPNSSQNKLKKTKKIEKKKKKTGAAVRAPRVKKNLNEPYTRILNQLRDDSDSEVQMQRATVLLENLLETLEKNEGVSRPCVIRFLEKVKTDMNLKEVMQYFKIRKNKH